MLDNGYVYLAASRLSVHASTDDWGIVIEVFGYSPRGGYPDIHICTFSNHLVNRNGRDDYVSDEAYQRYLLNYPFNESRFVYPMQDDWRDSEDEDAVKGSGEFTLRERTLTIPSADDYEQHGVKLEYPPRVDVVELCRLLAATHRDEVLATPTERRTSIPDDLDQVLLLDDWHHPDLAGSELPSHTTTFCQIAEVAASGDPAHYTEPETPNTHWSNWPDGGLL
jgi:hypothetical protein